MYATTEEMAEQMARKGRQKEHIRAWYEERVRLAQERAESALAELVSAQQELRLAFEKTEAWRA